MSDDSKKPAARFRFPDPGSDEIAPRTPADPAPQGVGDLLQRTREKHERSVPDIAAELNIRAAYIEALEQGRFDRLPGKTYAIGFLRSYADFLGLDSKDLVRRFKDEVAGLGQGSQLVFPTPVPESRLPGGALILVSLVLFAGAYGAWSVLTGDGKQLAELVPAVPDHLQELVTRAEPANGRRQAPVPAPQNQARPSTPGAGIGGPYSMADSPASPVVPAPESTPQTTAPSEPPAPAVAEEPAPVPVAAPAVETAAPATPEPEPVPLPTVRPQLAETVVAPESLPPARVEIVADTPEAPPTADSPTNSPPETLDSLPGSAAAPAPAPSSLSPSDGAAEIPAAPDTTQLASLPEPSAPQIFGQSNLGARVILRAKQDSWIQVREGPEQLLISRVLQTGDSYRVPDRPGILLQTGNAGGIDVEVDGRNLGPFGAVGAVRRDVPLDPERLLDGSAFRR